MTLAEGQIRHGCLELLSETGGEFLPDWWNVRCIYGGRVWQTSPENLLGDPEEGWVCRDCVAGIDDALDELYGDLA